MPISEEARKRYEAKLAEAKSHLADYDSGKARMKARQLDGTFADSTPEQVDGLLRTIATLEALITRSEDNDS